MKKVTKDEFFKNFRPVFTGSRIRKQKEGDYVSIYQNLIEQYLLLKEEEYVAIESYYFLSFAGLLRKYLIKYKDKGYRLRTIRVSKKNFWIFRIKIK